MSKDWSAVPGTRPFICNRVGRPSLSTLTLITNVWRLRQHAMRGRRPENVACGRVLVVRSLKFKSSKLGQAWDISFKMMLSIITTPILIVRVFILAYDSNGMSVRLVIFGWRVEGDQDSRLKIPKWLSREYPRLPRKLFMNESTSQAFACLNESVIWKDCSALTLGCSKNLCT